MCSCREHTSLNYHLKTPTCAPNKYAEYSLISTTVLPPKVSAQQSRTASRVHLPLKVQGKAFHYLLDMKGDFTNSKLFDYSAGISRNWSRWSTTTTTMPGNCVASGRLSTVLSQLWWMWWISEWCVGKDTVRWCALTMSCFSSVV